MNPVSLTGGDIVISDIDSTLADTRHRRDLCPTVNPESTWDAYAAACAADAPIHGVIAVLRLLHAAGCDIHLVSDRPVAVGPITKRWLARHEVPWNALDLLAAGVALDGARRKVDCLRRLRAAGRTVALVIEDWPAQAAALEAEGVPVLCPNPRYEFAAVPA